ncbi:MAG: hypothetical protein K9W44_01635 [Candidatus Lokiarchaeota archaeon]|nr:hypothetical protein [Candidatus Harpocratesius repetitus]
MTHIFYADRKFEREIKRKNVNEKENLPPVHAGTSWIDSLGYVFWFLKQWMRLRLYLLFNLFPLPLREGIAGALGQLFLYFSKTNRNKVLSAFHVLYPKVKSRSILHRLYFAHCAYMGKLFFDFMNGLPKNIDLSLKNFISFKNLNLLFRELEKGKGVIIPTTHLGQLVHSVYAIMKLPQKIPVATVIYTPHLITYQYTNRIGYDHVYLYASTSFVKISHHLERHLRKNHIVVLYFDFGTKKQLRVPFYFGKYPYLLHTPQSCVSLYLKTGASILPCINQPDHYIHYSRLIFCENQNLMKIAAELQDKPKKIIHGKLSMEINRILYPTIIKYAHAWEEITDLATARLADELILPQHLNGYQNSELILEKMKSIIKNSYEPNRNDELIFEKLDILQNTIKKYRKNLENLDSYPKTINLSWMNSFDEFRILMQELISITKNCGETDLKSQIDDQWQDLILEFYSSNI